MLPVTAALMVNHPDFLGQSETKFKKVQYFIFNWTCLASAFIHWLLLQISLAKSFLVPGISSLGRNLYTVYTVSKSPLNPFNRLNKWFPLDPWYSAFPPCFR